MDSTFNTAYALMLGRLDKAGLTIPAAQTEYFERRLAAAYKMLLNNGINIDLTSPEDNALLADYAAWTIQNRDHDGAMPKWLQLMRVEAFLRSSDEEAAQ